MTTSSAKIFAWDARFLAFFLFTTGNTLLDCVAQDPHVFLYSMVAWRLGVLFRFFYLDQRSFAVGDGTKTPLNFTERLLVAVPLMGTAVFWMGIKAPHNWESNVWSSIVDVFMAVYVVTVTDDKKQHQADACSTTVLEMFTWFYTAAGFWKINTHFLDPTASCATVFLAQHVTYYGGPFASSPLQIQELAQTLQPWFPVITIGIELVMGLSLAAVRCFGTPLGRSRTVWMALGWVLLFHLAVCITPRPHDISAFAVQCACRLALVIPEVEAWQTVLTKLQRYVPLLFAVAVLYVSYGVHNDFTMLNWYFGLFAPVAVLDLWAAAELLTMNKSYSTNIVARAYSSPPNWMRVSSFLAFFYSFGMISLGLMEEASPNMFANLKIHGGSNHLLLPTGLLFHWAAVRESQGDDAGSSFLVRHWGGGEIRLEATNSEWLTEIYPNDMTHVLEPVPVVAELLQDHLGGSRPGVYFNSGTNRVLGARERGFVPPPPHGLFISYTVPALEWKRLLEEALHYKGRPSSFTVDYVHLPGTKGNEEWRAFAWERRVHLEVVHGEIANCTVKWNAEVTDGNYPGIIPCGPNEIPYQVESVPWWLSKLSMYHGYPILYNADGTARSSISCFGP